MENSALCGYCKHLKGKHFIVLGYCKIKGCNCPRFVEKGKIGKGVKGTIHQNDTDEELQG